MEERNRIAQAFGGKTTLPKADLAQFMRRSTPAMTDTTLNWRIHTLIQAGQLVQASRGIYALPQKPAYQPAIHERMHEIGTIVRSSFPYLDISIFHTAQLSPWMQHLPGRHFIVLEVERSGLESVFFQLQSMGMRCFLQPDRKTMSRYVAFEDSPVLLQPLLSEAPLLAVGDLHVPALEKLLVDLACEKAIYQAFQGAELRHIYQNAFAAFHIRQDRMLRYADRRRRKPLVQNFLKLFDIPSTI